MKDDNWDLINGQAAHHIEQLNAINTINVLEALVTFLIARKDPHNNLPLIPNEHALRELHRSGTLFLLNAPGEYRSEDVVVGDIAGNVIYRPPSFADVQLHMDE